MNFTLNLIKLLFSEDTPNCSCTCGYRHCSVIDEAISLASTRELPGVGISATLSLRLEATTRASLEMTQHPHDITFAGSFVRSFA